MKEGFDQKKCIARDAIRVGRAKYFAEEASSPENRGFRLANHRRKLENFRLPIFNKPSTLCGFGQFLQAREDLITHARRRRQKFRAGYAL
jgi:hypothetical protein